MASPFGEWNPIVVREYRARWRGWSSFALLLGYAALLALTLFWRYADAFARSSQQNNPLLRMEVLGAELFFTLIWMQSFAWALIGPAITATSLAGERESGMLEAVQLSPLSPAKIVAGKLVSALSFIALLLLVSLPVTATCFLMGGVAPEDFLAALALHGTTAFFGAALGLACSAWSRRANVALRSAYVLSVLWLVGSLISFGAIAAARTGTGNWHWLWQILSTLFGWSNPIIATAAITDPSTQQVGLSVLGGWELIESSPWLLSVVFQLLMSGLLLASAAHALRRPFAEQVWLDPHKILEVPPASAVPHSTTVQDALAPSSTRPADKPPGSTPAPAQPVKHPKVKARSDWWSIPVVSRLQFLNPVLQRETRAKFRMRQPSLWVLMFEALLAIFVGYFYFVALKAAFFEPEQREIIWWIITFVGLTVVAITAAVSGANAFTRERETKTWEALRLSLLSPAEVINAKLGAILIGFFVFSLPFWPLLLPCIHFSLSAEAATRSEVSLVQALLCLGIVTATAVCYSLWGMFWSWRCRKTSAAVGWTLGTIFFALVFAPAFFAFGISSRSSGWNEMIWSYHPFVAMAFTADGGKTQVSAGAVGVIMLLGGACWLKLKSDLQHERTAG